MLTEDNIIARLKAGFPDYIGDDAAIIEQSNGQSYVVTKDVLVEDVHFRTSYFDPTSLAHKALQVNLSDMAAMGAKPSFVLLGISIPQSRLQYAEEFIEAFTGLCKKEAVALIGGDTTRSPDKLFISVTAIGIAPSQAIKRRATAKAGDFICVAGEMGSAHLGFIASERALDGLENYKKAFLRPEAKIKEGQWLGTQDSVTSLMDLSDGLFVDLTKLCQASELQAEVDLDLFKPSRGFIDSCKELGLDPVDTMLAGGEDYSLLFTVAPAGYQELTEGFTKRFGYAVKPIGHITKRHCEERSDAAICRLSAQTDCRGPTALAMTDVMERIVFISMGERRFMKLKSFSHFEEAI
jgi:thiamine-monophosphate kinase